MLKSIKLSDYFEIKRPTYTYIKILPHTSIRNYNSSNIIKSIALTYKSLDKRIRRENKKIFIETNFKISYVIDICKDNASFYFIVPTFYKNILIEKIKEIWSTATVREVEPLEELHDPINYSVSYKKDDGLSISTDSRNNEPLNSILNVMDIMKDDDIVRISYNFMPISQAFWKEKYSDTMNKIKNGKPLEKDTFSFEYILKTGLGLLLSVLDVIINTLEDFLGSDMKDRQESIYKSVMNILGQQNVISNSTRLKKESTVVNTQIAVQSSSKDLTRKNNNAISCCQSFKVLDEDNELIYKKVKNLNNAEVSTMSIKEVSNFLQIPGYNLLEEHNIEHIEVTESLIPEELKEGAVCIGESTYKGKNTKAYLNNDIEYRNLPLAITAPTRAGKSTFIENIARDCITAGECVINFDFCGECKLSKDLERVIPKDKILNIDCSNINKLQGLGFNEIQYAGKDLFKKYESSKMQTSNFVYFIDSINVNNPLEPRMLRYLKAACMVSFYNNKSFKDVFKVLEDYKYREDIIKCCPDDLYDYTETLKELNDIDKAGNIKGTKTSYIQSILNRIDIIKENTYMELMYKKSTENNFNLVQEMQKKQLINIKIPESMFSTDTEKDIYCLYWLIKIWGALQQRMMLYPDNRVKVNLLIDEIYQVKLTQTFLKTKINQIAKKTCKPILSCHSLQQINYIRPELKSANTSYMLLSGCNKDNYRELEEELYPYTLQDLLNLKRYHSLNLIKTNDGYAKFITALPKPI